MRNKGSDCRKNDICISEKENRPKCILKEQLEFIVIFGQNQAIQNTNASACMHNNVATPYDNFQFSEKYYFPMFS
jgi:hypothetical protein